MTCARACPTTSRSRKPVYSKKPGERAITNPHPKHPHHGKGRPFLFNPCEVALVGRPGPGPSAFAARLKDFWEGSLRVSVHAWDGAGDPVSAPPPWELLDADLVLISTSELAGTPSVIVLDDSGDLPDVIAENDFSGVIACTGPGTGPNALPSSIPYFQQDDSSSLAECVKEHLDRKINERPLNGLVLTGGHSTRMGKDKAALNFKGRMQSENAFALLSAYCTQVYLSNREDQAAAPGHKGFPQIHDSFIGFGPMGGILSALKADAKAAWLVLACDLPYLNEDSIARLTERRNPYKMATAYLSAVHPGLPEPLCAIYEPKSVFRLMSSLASGIHCPRKVMIQGDVELVEPVNDEALRNVNHPDEYQEASQFLE